MAAPYGKRVVLLQGHPIINEDGVASGAITPGYLVQGVGTIAVHATPGGFTQIQIAVERDELGTGIDNTYPGVGTGSPFYASGDTVKVAVLYRGCRFTGWLASGQNVTAGDSLESNGDGTFREFGSGTRLARSLDTINSGGVAGVRCRMESF